MIKKVIGIMVIFGVVLIGGGGAISIAIKAMVGGGVSESYIYPIYGGIILLAGLIVGCTCIIIDEINKIHK